MHTPTKLVPPQASGITIARAHVGINSMAKILLWRGEGIMMMMMMMILFFKLVEAMQIVVVRQALFGVWRLLWVRGLI